MQLTEFMWQLLIVFLPGMIATLLVRYISTNKEFTPFYFLTYSLILGLLNLLFLELCIFIYNYAAMILGNNNFKMVLNLTLWDTLLNQTSTLKKSELFYSYIFSLPVGIISGIAVKRKWLINILQKLKLTTRFGDDDVWEYFFNSNEVEWVLIREYKKNLTYFGKVIAFSETKDTREIILGNVDVYFSDNFEKLYSSEFVYLTLEEDNFSVEVPKPKEEENE